MGWSISNTMTAKWCTELMEDTIKTHGKPEIFNTDKGVQYTTEEHISALKKHDIKISMDGKGRATDNAFIERFWRTIKYDKVYLEVPADGTQLHRCCAQFINFYNQKREHSELGYDTPNEWFKTAA